MQLLLHLCHWPKWMLWTHHWPAVSAGTIYNAEILTGMEEVYSCFGCDMDGRGGKVNSVETVIGLFLLLMFSSSLAPSHRLLICIFVVLVKIIRRGVWLYILDNKTSSSLSAGRQ